MAYYPTLRRTLASLRSRRYYSSSCSCSCSDSLFRLVSNPRAPILLNRRPTEPPNSPARFSSTGSNHTPLESNEEAMPRWFNAENSADDVEVVIDGCDFEHWLVIMGFPEGGDLSEEEMINVYVSTLAKVVGSEEEAKKKIYSVSTVTYTGFGALISREISRQVKGLPGVLWVLPDSYIDVPTKDYGGDLYVDGKVIHRPEFRFPNREQVPVGSDSDDNKYKEQFMEDELENKQQEMQAELFDWSNMLKTQKKEPRLRTESLRRPAKGNENMESNDEETREKETEVVTEEASQNKSEESEVAEAPKEIHDLFTKLRDKMKDAKIETAQSSDRESEWANVGEDFLEQTEDPDKARPDMNKLKEAVKSFQLGLKLCKNDEANGCTEEAEWLREKLELIKHTDSELLDQSGDLEGSEDSEIARQDSDKVRGMMNSMSEPIKIGNDDKLSSSVNEIERSEEYFSVLENATMQCKTDDEMSPEDRSNGSNDEPSLEQRKSGDIHEASQ